MGIIKNIFGSAVKVNVTCCHHRAQAPYCKVLSPGESDKVEKIGDLEGYLTLYAFEENNVEKKIESKMILRPPFSAWGNHSIILSYDRYNFEWTIMATEKEKEKVKGFKQCMKLIRDKIIWILIVIFQIDVNVEIGPK